MMHYIRCTSCGVVVLCIVAVAVASCGGSDPAADGSDVEAARAFSSNGARIFFTAVSARDDSITVRGVARAPDGRSMYACADCHGPDGRGAPLPFGNATYRTPDITFAVLASTVPPRRKAPYTEGTLGLTLRTGVAVDGRKLDEAMPRWNMNEEDVRDLIAYLKTLSTIQPVPTTP